MRWRGIASLLAAWLLAIWAICATWSAGAATLTGSLTADDAFVVYIGKSSSEPGTLIAQGYDWAKRTACRPSSHARHLLFTHRGDQLRRAGGFDRRFYCRRPASYVTDTTNWFAARNVGSPLPRQWVPATGRKAISLGLNGVAPWGRKPGISSSAQWIDAFRGLSSCAGCGVNFSAMITVPAVLAAARRSTALRRQPRRP